LILFNWIIFIFLFIANLIQPITYQITRLYDCIRITLLALIMNVNLILFYWISFDCYFFIHWIMLV